MLVLSRKLGEEIRIGENITVRVVGIQGSRVKLGITAPEEVGIHRPESPYPQPEDQRKPQLKGQE